MANYKFENIFPFDSFKDDSIYLVLFHIDKMPPHLGLVVDSKYYSITIKEVELGLKAENIRKLISRKKIPTLIIEIEDDLKNVKQYYSKYTSLKDESITCLTPIKNYFADQLNTDSESIKVIFDLLDQLKTNNKIKSQYHLNLYDKIENNSFIIRHYSYEELQQYITTLRNKDKIDA